MASIKSALKNIYYYLTEKNQFDEEYLKSKLHELVNKYDFNHWAFINKLEILPDKKNINIEFDCFYSGKKKINEKDRVILKITFEDVIEVFATYYNIPLERNREIVLTKEDVELDFFEISYNNTAYFNSETQSIDMVYLLKLKANDLLMVFSFRNVSFEES